MIKRFSSSFVLSAIVGCSLISISLLPQHTQGVSLDEDLTLTYSQKQALDKFKTRVGSKLAHEYMQQDIYLVKWLRSKKFNLDAAERALLDNLEWRNNNKMDDILSEDWSDLEPEYRVSIEGCDNEGRPVISVFMGDWDIRRQVVAGKGARLLRYMDKSIEEIVALIRSSQQNGRNITQLTIIIDMNNYNLAQHGCPQCIPSQLYFIRTMQEHYPGYLHRLIVVNAPQSFQPVIALIRPILSSRGQKIVSFYGRDKGEWQQELYKEAMRDKLTKPYGGTRENSYDIDIYTKLGYFDCNVKE